MPSLLQEYTGSAGDREKKLKRAIESFLGQGYAEKQLIVVADGCRRTCEIVNGFIPSVGNSNILCLLHQRPEGRPFFAGSVRNAGLAAARERSSNRFISSISEAESNDLVCYLDSDDIFLQGHLSFIAERFKNNNDLDWAYYNDFIARDAQLLNHQMRGVNYFPGCIGTSSIVHKVSIAAEWEDGYGHDFKFVMQLAKASTKHKHIGTGGYLVCHIPKFTDF